MRRDSGESPPWLRAQPSVQPNHALPNALATEADPPRDNHLELRVEGPFDTVLAPVFPHGYW